MVALTNKFITSNSRVGGGKLGAGFLNNIKKSIQDKRLHSTSPVSEKSQITAFENGLRIVSEDKPGHFAALGFYVEAGSRYESPSTFGFSHFIDRLSFKTTENNSAEKNSEKIEALGGNISCFASRECIMYQAAVFSEAVDEAVQLLGETVFKPKFDTVEIEQVAAGIPWELADISSKPDIYLNELFHELAYKGNTLGNPLLCPETQIEAANPKSLKAYHNMWFSPDRVVIAAIGVDHQKLVDLCKRCGFETLPKFKHSVPETETPLAKPEKKGGLLNGVSMSLGFSDNKAANQAPVDLFSTSFEKSVYTGGIDFIKNDEAEFTNLQIGFESAGVRDEKKLYAYAALQMLLGGGGSFSAGGPGKGMYSRFKPSKKHAEKQSTNEYGKPSGATRRFRASDPSAGAEKLV
ncbi:Mitochondrial-processing peptidase subunit alpha [Smittium mucronatum]|uniref:Alpha-MPP n=1 Tax=Smittium mucronatum TaxID=133383 RepID=A0A1R0GR24_9FUNG|nr:Mitochondrial-processing peptidase subunit alpha [Smittium mucronatum]